MAEPSSRNFDTKDQLLRVIFADRRKSGRVRRIRKCQSSTGADCSGDVTPGSSSIILMLRK